MLKKIALVILLSCLTISTNAHAQSLENYIAQYNPSESRKITAEIISSGERYNIDPLFLASIFFVESRYNNTAVSYAGAVGISQLMPDTAAEIGVNPYNVASNIDGGSYYFRKMLDANADKGIQQYNYAMASYNAGLGNTINGIPSYTYGYIQDIQDQYYYLKANITSYGNTAIKPTKPAKQHIDSVLAKKKKLLAMYKLQQLKMMINHY